MPVDPAPHIGHAQVARWSALVPGLGQALRGYRAHGLGIAFLTAVFAAGAIELHRIGGVESAIFFTLMVGLPWWVLQAYDAHLPDPLSWRRTFRAVRDHAHDIRYLGALFLLTAGIDFYIIAARPEYALTVFCSKPAGWFGLLAKAQSPTIHVLIGIGFLRLRRWGLLWYAAYAAFGLLNAGANFVCFGYGRIRTVFVISLLLFSAYIWWRRCCFAAPPPVSPSL